MAKRVLLGALAAAQAALLIFAAGTAWSIDRYGQWSETGPADAAIVLGAAAWGREPSPVFRERINHAVDLYQRGYVRKLIFTGGQAGPNEQADAVVARDYAVQRGVARGDTLIETRSRITEQSLYNARELAGAAALNRLLIVSDPLHMKRAMLMARDLGLDAHPSPTPTTLYRGPRSRLAFLARETFFYLGYQLSRPFRGPEWWHGRARGGGVSR